MASSPPPSPSPSPAGDPPPPPPAAAPPPPPPRKFPAPCWTQDETLALISAYRDKWYSLRRRNLRTADWEAVAGDVLHRCPNSLGGPPKTSAQCRHKMEKLRKRYRTEKQRALSLSLPITHQGRFFSPSSWVFFDLMDSMETGSDPQTLNPPISQSQSQSQIPNAIVLRAVDDKPDLKNKAGINSSKDDLGKYFDEILMGMGSGGSGGGNPIKIRVKNHQNYDRNPNSGGPPPGFKRMFPNQEYDDHHRFDSSSKRRERERERERDSLGEMVSSIKMLGEGLVRMEKMKMEMMREIERMRMEMEMKRSEMILESQQLIVNAFVEGLKKHNTNNNKRVKVMEVE